MKKSTIILIIIIVASILVKISGINQPLYDDETNSVESVFNPGDLYTVNPISKHPHPPFAPWMYLFTGALLGAEVWVFRLVPLIFSIASMILIFVIVKRYYSERSALWSTALYGLCFYPVLASLQTDDASITITFFLLTTLFYLRFRENEKKRYLIPTGIFFGISLLSKYTSVFLFIIIIIHSFISKTEGIKFKSILRLFNPRNILRTFIEVIIIGIIAAAIFSMYPIFAPEIFRATIGHSSQYFGLNISLMALAMLLFWATSLLLIPALIQILKFRKKDSFWTTWAVVIFIIGIFLLSGRGQGSFLVGGIAEYSRYMMIIIPSLSVLSGLYISSIRFNKRILLFIGIVTGTLLAVFYYLNYNFIAIVPREFSIYLKLIKEFMWNFTFSYTTSSGNLLGVNFLVLVIAYAVSIVFLITYFYGVKRNPGAMILSLMILLSAGFAVNIFLVSEYVGPVTSLDVNKATWEMIEFVKDYRHDLNLYSNDEGLLLLANDFRVETDDNNYHLGVYCDNCHLIDIEKNSLVALMNFPPQDKKTWQLVDGCVLIKNTYSKGIKLGYLYLC